MDEIKIYHQGYSVVLPDSLRFDVVPQDVLQPDGFPIDRPVRVDRVFLHSSYLGQPYITAAGTRRLLDGSLSAQHFAGCTIRWSQIPTEVRKLINAKTGSEIRKWWRA